MGLAVKKKVVLLVVSFALAVVCAELGLRWFFAPHLAQIYVLDDEVLHRLVPGSEKYFTHDPANGGERILIRVNADGYRGAEFEPRAGRQRVVVYGDSFVMGEFSPLAETFVEQLEDRLEASRGRPVECINAGVVAYGPDQSLVRMERELAGLNADLALLVVFADNDFGDLLRNKMFRLVDSDGRAELEWASPVITEHLREKFSSWPRRFSIVRAVQKFLRERKADRARDAAMGATEEQLRATAYAFTEQWLPACRAEYENFVVDGNAGVRSLFEDHYDTDIAVEPDSPSARYKTALMGAVLRRCHAVADAARVPLLVVVVPSPTDVCGLDHGSLVDAETFPAYDPRRLSRVITDHCASASIPCFDLFEVFRERGADDLYFLPPDNHWNAAGQALAAEQVAAAIDGHGWLRR